MQRQVSKIQIIEAIHLIMTEQVGTCTLDTISARLKAQYGATVSRSRLAPLLRLVKAAGVDNATGIGALLQERQKAREKISELRRQLAAALVELALIERSLSGSAQA